MIGSKEAENMTYLVYKRTFWRRMLYWWNDYGSNHPERAEFVAERVQVAQAQVAKWTDA